MKVIHALPLLLVLQFLAKGLPGLEGAISSNTSAQNATITETITVAEIRIETSSSQGSRIVPEKLQQGNEQRVP